MEQIGFVRKVEKDNMELEVRRVSGCGNKCQECSSGCEVVPHIIVIPNNLNAKVGDFVEIHAEVSSLLKYTFIIYMVPFIFLIMGIVIGNLLFKSIDIDRREMFSLLSGLIFMIISYFILRIIDKKIGRKDNTTIKAIKIL